MDKGVYIYTNRLIDFEKTNKRFDEMFGEEKSNLEKIVRYIKGVTDQITETLSKFQIKNS
jgi:hypothetical protein